MNFQFDYIFINNMANFIKLMRYLFFNLLMSHNSSSYKNKSNENLIFIQYLTYNFIILILLQFIKAIRFYFDIFGLYELIYLYLYLHFE